MGLSVPFSLTVYHLLIMSDKKRQIIQTSHVSISLLRILTVMVTVYTINGRLKNSFSLLVLRMQPCKYETICQMFQNINMPGSMICGKQNLVRNIAQFLDVSSSYWDTLFKKQRLQQFWACFFLKFLRYQKFSKVVRFHHIKATDALLKIIFGKLAFWAQTHCSFIPFLVS